MAAVFEATFLYRLEAADGTVLAEGFEMTDNGMGWGSFDFTIDVDVDERQEGTLTGSGRSPRRTAPCRPNASPRSVVLLVAGGLRWRR
jgi:hypothetical protein